MNKQTWLPHSGWTTITLEPSIEERDSVVAQKKKDNYKKDNFEVKMEKGSYCLVEHKITKQRKWVKNTGCWSICGKVDDEAIVERQESFFDADQHYEP